MGQLLGLIYLIACIVGTLDCVKSSKDSGKKILWLVLIWLIPYIGVIAYFLVGKKQ